MSHIKIEVVNVFDPESDMMVQKRYAKLRMPVPNVGGPGMLITNGNGEKDVVREPILRILKDNEHEMDPLTVCVKGNRPGCRVYSELERVSRSYCSRTSKAERKRDITPPDLVFMLRQPRFCRICLTEEHKRRREANRPGRRLLQWLSLSR